MAGIADVHQAVTRFFASTLAKGGRVIAIRPLQDGYRALFETVEEDEYMRRIGRDEIVAVYEVDVDRDLEVKGYCRRHARTRTAVPEPAAAVDGERLPAPVVVMPEL